MSTQKSDSEIDALNILVGIPAYNAENTVDSVVRKASTFVDSIIVVNDGSDDATALQAREAGATVVSHKRNQGYGGALKTIFKEAYNRNVDTLITLDADEQHDPSTIPKLVETQRRTGADVIIGSRYVTDSTTDIPFVRSLGLNAINLLTNWSMGRFPPHKWIRDTQSGLRAYNREAIESLATANHIGDGMLASTDILYQMHQEGFSFFEVETTIRYDVESGSTEKAVSHGMSLVKNIVHFAQRNHPLLLLGIPGAILLSVGVIFSILVIELLLLPQFFPLSAVLLAIMASLFIIFGISFLFFSILLHMINIHPYFR
jgi:glycosyltransferase involved in cell wall biosynthesis